MPFNSSGNYTPPGPPTFPAVPRETIKAADYNAVIQDIANALSQCSLKSGASQPTGDQNLGGYRIVNMGNPQNAQDATTKMYVDTGRVLEIGLFSTASLRTVPAGTNVVLLSGFTAAGDAGAGRQLAYDPAVNAAYVAQYPQSSFLDTTGRGFRLVESPTPVAVSASAADWSALPNLTRKILQAAYYGADAVPIKIKVAGIGSSNMLNEGGGLAGPNNSPVEVALRQMKAKLDPHNNIVWEFRNFGVNGSAVSGYDAPDPAHPTDPTAKQNIAAYKPDVTIICYVTNDASLEGYTAGQTRGLYGVFLEAIIGHLNSVGSDAIVMTAPHARVALWAPNDRREINQTIGVAYPYTSFAAGLGAQLISMTCTSGNNRITSALAGIFTNANFGFGMAVGKVIAFGDPNFGSSIPNSGNYRVSAIDPAGNWIEVGQKVILDAATNRWVDNGAASFVNSTANSSVRRIGIDPDTEQVPRANQVTVQVYPADDGRAVKVLQTFLDINEDTRRTVANSIYPCMIADMESGYLVGLLTTSENRWYRGPVSTPLASEIVHWNANFVSDVMEPTFSRIFSSLGPNSRAISNEGAAPYLPAVRSRPAAGSNSPRGVAGGWDQYNNAQPVDLQMDSVGRAVFRDSGGRQILEVNGTPAMQSGSIRERIYYSPTQYLALDQWKFAVFNIAPANPVVYAMPTAGVLRGMVYAAQPGIAKAAIEVYALWDGSTWNISSTTKAVLPAPATVVNFSGSGANFSITPVASNTTVMVDMRYLGTDFTTLPNPTA